MLLVTGGATWVGRVEHPDIGPLDVGAGFAAALLVVTVDGVPAGRARVPLADGTASADDVRAAVAEQVGGALAEVAPPLPAAREPITVVVATRNRAESLARCVRSLLVGVDDAHGPAAVIVVDNDPVDDSTAAVVRALADPRVRYVREPGRGTSIGRNRGLAEAVAAGARYVAFVDDDVEVDPGWVGRMAAALEAPGVACVCGPVFAARLDTAAQVAADDGLGWRKGFARRTFSLADPPPDSAVFPFSPGLFGVGANMAVDARVATALGGFDPALGPGTAARGGEDCEFMIRLVLAGHALAHEPSAFLWHHHRPSATELADQMDGYSLGLGAFVGKIMLDPVGRAAAVRRIPAAVRQLRHIRDREAAAQVSGSPGMSKVRALVLGPAAYVRGRRRVRRAGGEPPVLTTPRESPHGIG